MKAIALLLLLSNIAFAGYLYLNPGSPASFHTIQVDGGSIDTSGSIVLIEEAEFETLPPREEFPQVIPLQNEEIEVQETSICAKAVGKWNSDTLGRVEKRLHSVGVEELQVGKEKRCNKRGYKGKCCSYSEDGRPIFRGGPYQQAENPNQRVF